MDWLTRRYGLKNDLLMADLTWQEIETIAQKGTVVIFPTGSTEQHGLHLPLRVDAMIAEAVALEAAREAAKSISITVAPTLHLGYSDEHMDYPGTISLPPNILLSVYLQVISSLHTAGFRRIFILNGHGGNEAVISLALMESKSIHRDLLVTGSSYWRLAAEDLANIQDDRGSGIAHGGDVETALVSFLNRSLVDYTRANQNRSVWGSPYLKGGFDKTPAVMIGRRRSDISNFGSMGNPKLGTPEKGAEMYAVIVKRVVEFLVDFAGWPFPSSGQSNQPVS
jgi:creatinine amidohydrolase